EGTDKAAAFYNPLAVSAVNLTMPQATVNELNNNPGTTVYQPASVSITTADGVTTTISNIGVRLKGQATRTNLYGKAAMKLKFDAFVDNQKFMGLTRMTLNSMAQDPSYLREATAYRFYRAMGLIAPRTTYSWVTVNGADFGLYANVESVDSQMVKRWVEPKHIYSSNCYMADLTYSQSWCFDTNYGDSDRSDLNAAIAVSSYDGATWWNEVNKVADMTSVINLMAADLYSSNWDGYTDVVQNNYYIVFDMQNKLRIIPWGQDQAFPIDSSAQLDWLGRGPAFRNFGNQERSVMLRKCVAYAPCQKLLVQAQVEIKKKTDALNLPDFKNKIAAVINNAYVRYQSRSNSNLGDVIFWQNWLDVFFGNRNSSLTSFLNSRAPDAPDLSLNGSATVGSTLTAEATSWDYTATMSYQWLRDGQPIPNETSRTYQLKPEDQAKLISVRVTASKGILPSASTLSQAVLVSSAQAPNANISGSAVVAGLLSATPTASSSIQVSYKWNRAGRPISGATSSTYKPTLTDFGKSITVTTTVLQTGFAQVISTSPAVTIGAGNFSSPTMAIFGSPAVGNSLALTTSQVETGTRISFQWLRNSAPIASATRSTYLLKADDLNANVSVRMTISKTGYNTLTTTASAKLVGLGTL
ncbi:MAG: hypothetical protein EB103_06150, partial [Actinobacteria bacterium]|nr:hypothetical protein [Actinomycetota bacterium]